MTMDKIVKVEAILCKVEMNLKDQLQQIQNFILRLLHILWTSSISQILSKFIIMITQRASLLIKIAIYQLSNFSFHNKQLNQVLCLLTKMKMVICDLSTSGISQEVQLVKLRTNNRRFVQLSIFQRMNRWMSFSKRKSKTKRELRELK